MSLTRRRFLQGTLASTSLLGTSGLIQIGCGNRVEPAPIIKTTLNDAGFATVQVNRYPELMQVGGAVTLLFDLPADSPFESVRSGVLLVHRGSDADPPAFIAVQSACPHAGCPLGYNAGDKLIECPCHSSRFRAAAGNDPADCVGKVLHLPAKQDLVVYSVVYNPSTTNAVVNVGQSTRCGGLASLPAPDKGVVTLLFTDFADLAKPGGTVVGQPDGYPDRLIVVRIDDATVKVTSATCTHLSCDVGWDAAHTQLLCPCHGSTYTVDGVVTMGPATRNLKSYPAVITATGIAITVA